MSVVVEEEVGGVDGVVVEEVGGVEGSSKGGSKIDFIKITIKRVISFEGDN